MSDEAWLPFVASYILSCIQKQAHHTHQLMANLQVNPGLPVVSSPLEFPPPVAAKENFWEYKWCRFTAVWVQSCHHTNIIKSLEGTQSSDPNHRKWPMGRCLFLIHQLPGRGCQTLSLTPAHSTKVNTSKGTIILINLSNNAEAINKF